MSTGRSRAPTVTVGTTGLNFAAGYVNEEWLHQLRGPRGVRIYREMSENDATTGGSLRIIEWLVRQTQWMTQPASIGGKQADDCAQFVDECISDMEHTWTSYVAEVLSMLVFGWASFFPAYKVRGGLGTDDPTKHSHFDDNRIGWRSIRLRAQETLYRWDIDDEGTVHGWWQQAAPHYASVYLPMERLVHFRLEEHKNSPEGRSLLRIAYRSWFFLKRMQEIEAIGIERDLVGLPILEVPIELFDTGIPMPDGSPNPQVVANQEKLIEYHQLVQQVRRNEHEGVVLPSELNAEGKPTGYKLKLLSTGGSRQLNPSTPVERYQQAIAQGFLTQLMFLGMNGAGTQALSGNLLDQLSIALMSILDVIEETHHRFVTVPLLKLNGFPPEVWCRIKHGQVLKQNMESLSKALLNLSNGGFITPTRKTEEWLRSEGQLPELDEDEESVADADARQAAADREALLAQQQNQPPKPPAQPQPMTKPTKPTNGSTDGKVDAKDA